MQRKRLWIGILLVATVLLRSPAVPAVESDPLPVPLPVTHNFCFRASWGMLRTPFLSYIAKSNR